MGKEPWLAPEKKLALKPAPAKLSLLCSGEGQFKILLVLGRIQCVVVKGFRKERVYQCTEAHPITPAGGEVLQINVL